MKPTHLRELPPIIVLDYPTRINLENQRLEEMRETARKDMARISFLWAEKCYQRKHTEREPEGIA